MSAQRTVLVIDDDAECREALARVLQLNGWRILQAGDGDHGLNLAREHRPDAVVCDLLMSPVSGFQFCKSLRAIESLTHTKIIMISARDFESDRQASLEAGADDFLAKPLRADQVLARLSGLCACRPAPAEPARDEMRPALSPNLRICFWGVRGSIPTPGATTLRYGGNTTCLEVRAGGEIVILDAGTGLRLLGKQLVTEFGQVPLDLTLLLTHTHWDHIQGLPFFQPMYQPHHHLRILGYEGARNGLANVLAGQMESPVFPVGLREVPGNVRIEELKDLSFNIGAVQVQATFAHHPGICMGYRLTWKGRSIAFFPDNELRSPESEAIADPAHAEFAREQQHKLVEFIRGVDVLVMDSQYDTQEYSRHVGWGHGCIGLVVELALQAQVKQLFLFHHDPNHDDDKIQQMEETARRLADAHSSSLTVQAAREGLVVELKPAARGSAG